MFVPPHVQKAFAGGASLPGSGGGPSSPMMNRQFMDFIKQAQQGAGQMNRAAGDPIAQRILGLQNQLGNTGRPDMKAFEQAQLRRKQLGTMQERLQAQMDAPATSYLDIMSKLLSSYRNEQVNLQMQGVEGPTAAGIEEQLMQRKDLMSQLETARAQDFTQGRDSFQAQNAIERQKLGQEFQREEGEKNREALIDRITGDREFQTSEREAAQDFRRDLTGTTTGLTPSEQLAREKFQYEKEQDQIAAAQELMAAEAEEMKEAEAFAKSMLGRGAALREELDPLVAQRNEAIEDAVTGKIAYGKYLYQVDIMRDKVAAGHDSSETQKLFTDFTSKWFDFGEQSEGASFKQRMDLANFTAAADAMEPLTGPKSDTDVAIVFRSILGDGVTAENAAEKLEQMERLLKAQVTRADGLLNMPAPASWAYNQILETRDMPDSSEYQRMMMDISNKAIHEAFPEMFSSDGSGVGSRLLEAGADGMMMERIYDGADALQFETLSGEDLSLPFDQLNGALRALPSQANRNQVLGALDTAWFAYQNADSYEMKRKATETLTTIRESLFAGLERQQRTDEDEDEERRKARYGTNFAGR